MARHRNTHRLRVFREVDSATETDSLGDPLEVMNHVVTVTVMAYPPGTQAATELAASRGMTIATTDMVAVTDDRDADGIAQDDHAVLERIDTTGARGTNAAVYIVEHSHAHVGRYSRPETWEIGLSQIEGSDTPDALAEYAETP